MKKIALLLMPVFMLACNDTKEESSSDNTTAAIPTPVNIGYTIVKVYPHDITSFTQGLIWFDNTLYEGTGWYGESRLMKMNLETGKSTQKINIPDEYFGEGITILNDKIYQLTWEQHKVFVYDLSSFKKIKEFDWNMQGWGITHNGKQLLISTGDSNIYFVNPETFTIEKTLGVYDNNGYLSNLNELEFVNGSIYANIYMKDYIAKINPETGLVEGRLDFTGLLQKTGQPITEETDVLNGIAFNPSTNSFYITGKRWPALYEIKLN